MDRKVSRTNRGSDGAGEAVEGGAVVEGSTSDTRGNLVAARIVFSSTNIGRVVWKRSTLRRGRALRPSMSSFATPTTPLIILSMEDILPTLITIHKQNNWTPRMQTSSWVPWVEVA
jgi:hypothetical protein